MYPSEPLDKISPPSSQLSSHTLSNHIHIHIHPPLTLNSSNMANTTSGGSSGTPGNQNLSQKPMAVRTANIIAARAVADAIRTSLGPRGMDKMIQNGRGQTLITNDGHTILKDMAVMHPAAKMLVDLSAAQDVEAGDGTTSVVVIAGALLGAAERLLSKGT